MATYTLSGSGVQALSAGVGKLYITPSVVPPAAGAGRANPTNYYDLALLRLGDSGNYYPAVPLDANGMVLAVPDGCTSLGYSILRAFTLTVVEVIGPSPFVGPAGPTGSAGAAGATGATGAAGVGVPTAGATGQVLTKASSTNYDTTWTTPAAGSTGALTLIQSIVVGAGGAANVSFSSIAATYKDLLMHWNARSTKVDFFDDLLLQLNGDTGSNYFGESLYERATTVAGQGGVSAGGPIAVGSMSAASSTAGDAGAGDFTIYNYAGTTFRKSVQGHFAYQYDPGDLYQFVCAIVWRSTAAVNAILLKPNTGSFVQGSRFDLYGIG